MSQVSGRKPQVFLENFVGLRPEACDLRQSLMNHPITQDPTDTHIEENSA
jgi:hypothetical protein